MKTCINKVELLGTVGSFTENTEVIHFSLATDRVYQAADKTAICETTWHHCTVPKKILLEKNMKISKGQYLHLKGFIRNVRYKHADGTSSFETQISVTDLTAPTNEFVGF